MQAKQILKAVCLLAFTWAPCLLAHNATAESAAPRNLDTGADWGDTLPADSPDLPDNPDSKPDSPGYTAVVRHGRVLLRAPMRPFSRVALSLKLGMGGVGMEVATPLAERINLRAGGSFLSLDPQFVDNSMDVVGNVKFRTAQASVDYYPFGTNFRVSPGVVLYNGNHVAANVTIPGGQSITFDDTPYISSAADPIIANVYASFGHKVAPSLTFGWGNMIPRDGRHWSFPFEMGFEYIGTPSINLTVSGSACQQGNCGPIDTDPTTRTNVLVEQNKLNKDVAPLRFYPIISTGVGFRF